MIGWTVTQRSLKGVRRTRRDNCQFFGLFIDGCKLGLTCLQERADVDT